jgi:archaellum biogenesis protein FlaJ (TadC family)
MINTPKDFVKSSLEWPDWLTDSLFMGGNSLGLGQVTSRNFLLSLLRSPKWSEVEDFQKVLFYRIL